MVGVAGRSKGCHTCRKRKVKCDELKPICHRCTRGGFECLGYKRQTAWKHTTVDASHGYSKTLGTDTSSQLHYLRWGMTTTGVPRVELDLGAFKSDFCFARIFDNFVWASLGIGWMGDAATGKMGTLPLEALKALSETNFGRLENIPDLKLTGATQYGLVLRYTANALGRNGNINSEELLVSVLVLLMYALYYPYRQWEAFLERGQGAEEEHMWGEVLQTDRTAVVSHVSGMTKLLNFCGPGVFQTGRSRALFDCIRLVLTISCVYNRRRSFLQEHQWRSVPWALGPSSKTEQSKLMDIFVVIPGLLEDYEKLVPRNSEGSLEIVHVESMIDSSQRSRTALSRRIATQLQFLFKWRCDWQQRYGSGVKLDSLDQLRGTQFKFLGYRGLTFDHKINSLVRAADLALYNALLIWLLALLWNVELQVMKVRAVVAECARTASIVLNRPESARQINPDGSAYNALFEPLLAPGHFIGLRGPAMEICRIYEWQSRHHHLALKSTEAILMYVYPLGMATVILEGDETVQRWITEMVANSPVTSGYKAGRFKMFVLSGFVTKAMVDLESSH